jgi:hypothetical protein
MPLTCQFYNIDLGELSCDDRASLGCQIKARMTRKKFFFSFFRFNKCFNFHSQIDPGGQTQLWSFYIYFLCPADVAQWQNSQLIIPGYRV